MRRWPLDMPIMDLKDGENNNSETNSNIIDLDQCTKAFSITGTVGSGKTSGSGTYIALSYLNAGFSGIVLTAKTDEINHWQKLCQATGRQNDLIVFEEGSGLVFDPLIYYSRLGGGSLTPNLTNMLMSLTKISDRVTGTSFGGGDRFWQDASKRLITNVIDLLKLAREDISLVNIDKLARAANVKTIAATNPQMKPDDYEYLTDCLKKAIINSMTADERNVLRVTRNYFNVDFPNIPDRTRNSLLETFYSLVNPFLTGILSKYLCGKVSPELEPERIMQEGKIIIVNFPVKEYYETGAIIQSVYNRIMQQAIERRDLSISDRPCFYFIDEAHYFIDDYTMMFLTTARSKRACPVLITQSISNYYANMIGSNSRDKVASFLSNLVTKIMHHSNDVTSCNYYATTIGKTYQRISEYDPDTRDAHVFERYAYQVEPVEFTKLETGGVKNKGIVQAYITSSGTWSNGKNYMLTNFDQASLKSLL